MKIATFTIYKYTLPLRQPIFVHGVEISQREGLLVRLGSPEGVDGFGEIVPLSGLSSENLNEAYEEVQFLKTHLRGEHIPTGAEKLDGKFASWFEGIGLQPSVRFGMETAVLNLIANVKGRPLFQMINPDGHGQVRINASLQGTRYDVVQQAKKLKEEGFTVAKLKVGGLVDDSIAKVKGVMEALGDQVLLHLDANQSWNLEDAVRFGKGIDYARVSYIEEPLKKAAQVPEFYHETMIPVALDESLISMEFDEVKSLEGVDVLVLKPTVLGGIEKSWQLMQQAMAVGLQTVISSSYESGVGLLTLANLAGCTSRDHPAGLDTLKWFRQDLLKEKLSIQNGKIDISSRTIGAGDINFGLLKEIA